MHEEMNSISNMLSFRSSMNFVCTCFAGEICMNKILFKPNCCCCCCEKETVLSMCFWLQLIEMSLRTIWFGLNKHLGIPEEFISRWWAIVEARYSETQRHYHTLAHIEDMFHKFEIVKGKLRSPESVSLAIFFHE